MVWVQIIRWEAATLIYFLRSWKSQKYQAVSEALFKTEYNQKIQVSLWDPQWLYKYQFLKTHLSHKQLPQKLYILHHFSKVIWWKFIYIYIPKQLLVILINKTKCYFFSKKLILLRQVLTGSQCFSHLGLVTVMGRMFWAFWNKQQYLWHYLVDDILTPKLWQPERL